MIGSKKRAKRRLIPAAGYLRQVRKRGFPETRNGKFARQTPNLESENRTE